MLGSYDNDSSNGRKFSLSLQFLAPFLDSAYHLWNILQDSRTGQGEKMENVRRSPRDFAFLQKSYNLIEKTGHVCKKNDNYNNGNSSHLY